MKKILFFLRDVYFYKAALLVFFCLSLSCLTAQPFDCRPASASAELYGNNVRATIRNGGDMFWDGTRARFVVPATGVNGVEVSTIFAGGLWLSARDSSNQLKAATCTYRNRGNDFYPGPINTVTRETDRGQCRDWDKIFSVIACEVNLMIEDFNDNGTLDNVPSPGIMGWPGKGNPFFQSQMGFQLPFQSLAPFFDRNNDGVYNPYDGDYPSIAINGRVVIPAQLMWFVYNDIGNAHGDSGGSPLGVQVGVSCYAFSDSLLDNNVFVRYEVTNYSGGRLNGLRLGIWNDADLGCERDDYVGFYRLTNTSYIYNREPIDPRTGCSAPGFGGNPPVQAITFVDKQASSFMYYYRNDLPPVPNPPSPVNLDTVRHNILSGLWSDGSPLYASGNGYNAPNAPITLFAFDGNPNDTLQWSMRSASVLAADYRTVQSTFHPSLASDSTLNVDIMYSYHQGDSVRSATPNLDNVTLMMAEVPQMLQHYRSASISAIPCLSDAVWPGDTDNNGKVDFRDYLNIAVGDGVNATGPVRQHVFGGWNGEAASADWSTTALNLPNQLNIKYSDCNGDGQINDYGVVSSNFGLAYRTVADDFGTTNAGLSLNRFYGTNFPAADSICPIRWSSNPAIYSYTSNYVKYEVQIDPTLDLYGLAFELEYDPLMIEVRTTHANPSLNTTAYANALGTSGLSFLGKEADMLSYAVFQTDGTAEPLTSGAVGSLVFRLAIQRPFNDTAEVDSLFFRFKNIRGVRADGSIIALGSQDGVLVFSENPPVGIGTEPSIATFELTPNPSDGQIRLETDGGEAGTASVSVCNMLGQEVHRQALDGSSTSLSLQHLPGGVYLVNILGGEVRYAPQKVVIQR